MIASIKMEITIRKASKTTGNRIQMIPVTTRLTKRYIAATDVLPVRLLCEPLDITRQADQPLAHP
jgi:hypothetical protein